MGFLDTKVVAGRRLMLPPFSLDTVGLECFKQDVLPGGGAGAVASSRPHPSSSSELGEESID